MYPTPIRRCPSNFEQTKLADLSSNKKASKNNYLFFYDTIQEINQFNVSIKRHIEFIFEPKCILIIRLVWVVGFDQVIELKPLK